MGWGYGALLGAARQTAARNRGKREDIGGIETVKDQLAERRVVAPDSSRMIHGTKHELDSCA